jgi:hypothetical protein
MSGEAKQTVFHSLGASRPSAAEGDCATPSRKTWKTPKVITSEMLDAEFNPGPGPDGFAFAS